MSEEKKPLDKAFLMRKLYDDKKHITIEDMMAYIKDECPEKMGWFKGLYLAVDEAGKPKYNTLTIKKEFYKACVPEKVAPKKKSAREKLMEDMGWGDVVAEEVQVQEQTEEKE